MPGGQPALKLLAACDDTGAANALLAFTLGARGADVKIASASPATEVFISGGVTPDFLYDGNRSSAHKFFDEIQPDAVLIGTSLSGALERVLLLHARQRGIPTVGYVDWWSNFGRRFSSPGTDDLAYLPDIVAVMDAEASAGCRADGVPAGIIREVGNPYWDTLRDMPQEALDRMRRAVRERFGVGPDDALCILVSSNIRNLGLGLGYDEHDFLRAVSPLPTSLANGRRLRWMIKPHPAEPRDELHGMLAQYGVNAGLIDGLSGLEAIAAADYLAGMCSTMLFEAALCGRPVISLQPGMDENRLRFLSVFDRIGVTKAVTAQAGRDALLALVEGRLQAPDLSRVGFPIGGDTATAAIMDILYAIRRGI